MPAPIHEHANRILDLVRSRSIRLSTIRPILEEIAEISRVALGVERASVWLLRGDALECTVLVENSRVGPSTKRLSVSSCAAYVERLRHAPSVAIPDVHQDPSCRGLEPYLNEHGVGALLDIPLAIGGDLLGVICHEHVGGARQWSADETLFANLVATVVLAQLEVEEKLRAELRAEGTEARYEHLVASLPVVVYAFDIKTGKLDYLSPNVVELGGIDAAEWFRRGGEKAWIEAIEPADRGPVHARFRETISETFDPDITYRVRLPDGRRAFVRDRCAIVRDRLGKAVALHGMLSDVTAEHEAQLETREHARRFSKLLRDAELGAVMLDLEGRVTFVNGTFLQATGYEEADLLGKLWFELVIPSAERDRSRGELLGRLSSGEVPARTEGHIQTAQGEIKSMLWTNIALRNPSGGADGVASLGIDLTERQRIESRRQHAQRLESLGQLAAGIAHDFNNLLQVLFITNEELCVPGSDVRRLAAEQQAALAQARDLVESLLGFARGNREGQGECVVEEQLRTVQPLLARAAAPQPIAFELASGSSRIPMTGTELQQILLNLVSNAAHAMNGRSGGIHVDSNKRPLPETFARRHGLRAGDPFLVIGVRDRGVGISPETMERIFEPFFTSKADRGTGLGLATALAIARRAGGFIEVRSEPGVGSTFEVWLPT